MIAEAVGNYYGSVVVGWKHAGGLKYFLAGCWFAFPVAVQTVVHPSDAAGFRYWISGVTVPGVYSARELLTGEVFALLALAALVFVQLTATVLLYRRMGFMLRFWPLALILVGFFGNLGWWLGTGALDIPGAAAGFTPTVLMGIAGAALEHLGANFVFGPGERPAFDPEFDVA